MRPPTLAPLALAAALAASVPGLARAQAVPVVVDTTRAPVTLVPGGSTPGVEGVRARIRQIRGGRVVQPVVVLVPVASPAAAVSGLDGRDGADGRVGADGRTGTPGAPGRDPARPDAPPASPAPGGTGTPPVVGPGLAPLPRVPVRPLPDTVRIETLREVERQIVDGGLFRAAGVHFEFDRATLLDGSDATLDLVGDVLRRHPDLAVEIGGHTDDVGSAAYNRRLSERRAETVRRYLVERWGLAPERLVAVGYGETRPVVTNANDTGRAVNRRVEFAVLNR